MAGENSWTALLESWWSKIKAAFMRSVRSIIDFAQIGRIAERLERGDVEGAVEEVGLNPVNFRELDKAIAEAFEDGGKFMAKRIPAIKEPDGHRLHVQFDVRNPVAERILKEESTKLATEIVDDQREKFASPSGAQLAYPGDPAAPAEERINCWCHREIRIDYLKGLK